MHPVENAAGELGNQAGPWWVSAGAIVVGILTAITPILLQRWRDRHADAGIVDPEVPKGKRSAPVVVATVTEATKPRGMTGVELTTMLRTVDALSERLEAVEAELVAAQKRVQELERHESQRQWAYDQAIAWGVNAQGPTPRTIPEYLIPFMSPNAPLNPGGVT